MVVVEGLSGRVPSGNRLSSSTMPQEGHGPAGFDPARGDVPKHRTLKECLARYMDPEAFRTSVPDATKFTCKAAGKTRHNRLKARREIAKKRAEAAIRFFSKPENREALDRRGEP